MNHINMNIVGEKVHHNITITTSIPEDNDLEVNDRLLFYKHMISHIA